ncbi:Peroxin 13, N-terminal region-domain-containing protein [Lentinula raphanica]|uniref:Peroxisomal membrane protein PEX13 n=1 Tax=Lentinula raphanica TaxID=153919 RepID=A0AA38P8P8_9AGAR|nr:Peroxin 13, N-terminal region-domain-containing protein [Lentinula raphanica]
MGSPPKPWERSRAIPSASAPSLPTSTSSSSTTPTAVANSVPSSSSTVPERPTNSPATATTSSVSTTNPYSYGASPYSRLGTYGGYGSYGGGLGSYGGLGGYGGFGNYGGGIGGYGGYGGYGSLGMGYGAGMYGGGYGPGTMLGPNGVPIDANDNPLPPSLTQTLEHTTQHTFALLHSIVQTFSGVAQMLESTFMATHSSFFAMVGVIDQFGHLRNALGSVLGLFGEFCQFVNGKPVQGPSGPPPPRPSKKPLIIFLLTVFGIPYAMNKLVKILAARAEAQGAIGSPLNGQSESGLPPLDPSSLTFARSLYPFTATNSSELSLQENEIVAIMGKWDQARGIEVDPRIELQNGIEAEWWRGRTREGREGWFPRKWVEVLQRKQAPPKVD